MGLDLEPDARAVAVHPLGVEAVQARSVRLLPLREPAPIPAGEFVEVGFAFTGTGALANSRDRDPMSKNVGGASDRSVGGAAGVPV